MRRSRALGVLLAFTVLVVVFAALCGSAGAQALEDDSGASWRLEQPAPPKAPTGVAEAPAPIGLGHIGDIEFAPGMTNRGALITAGNPPTVPAGVWEYNGVTWHELSNVCGASDGRIVWVGPEEFWTISDARPGQASNSNHEIPPTRDNTLCRFSNPGHAGEPLRVMESFASPAFEANSYQAMNAGACLGATDCWFAGEPLPSASVEAGSFHLRWNGQSLEEQPYPGEGHGVHSMQSFEGRIYEGVRIGEHDRVESTEAPAALHAINAEGANPFEPIGELPLYGEGVFPTALDFLHLSTAGEILWAAAGPKAATPAGSQPSQLTVLRDVGGGWLQLLGPERTPQASEQPFPGVTVSALAAEPGSESAWLGLDSPGDYAKASNESKGNEPSAQEYARVARVSAAGAIPAEDTESLPSEAGVGPKGAAYAITCPAAHDCWLATTYGWIFHLATERNGRRPPRASAKTTTPRSKR